MKQLSVTEYAKTIGLTRQAVLVQIWQNRLPDGIIATKIGTTYIITIWNNQLNKWLKTQHMSWFLKMIQ